MLQPPLSRRCGALLRPASHQHAREEDGRRVGQWLVLLPQHVLV